MCERQRHPARQRPPVRTRLKARFMISCQTSGFTCPGTSPCRMAIGGRSRAIPLFGWNNTGEPRIGHGLNAYGNSKIMTLLMSALTRGLQ